MNALLIIGGLGAGELVLILVIVLIIFGAGKLPQIGDALGKGIRSFRQATAGKEDLDVGAKQTQQQLPPAQPPPVVADAEEVKTDASSK